MLRGRRNLRRIECFALISIRIRAYARFLSPASSTSAPNETADAEFLRFVIILSLLLPFAARARALGAGSGSGTRTSEEAKLEKPTRKKDAQKMKTEKSEQQKA